MVAGHFRRSENCKFSEEAVDKSWVYLSKWAGMPIHCRPYINIPYVKDGKVEHEPSFIEGLPALDNLPPQVLELYIKTYNEECEKMNENKPPEQHQNGISEEELNKRFREMGAK